MNDRNCWGFPTCCEYHGKESCGEGKECPAPSELSKVGAWVLFAAILAAAIAAFAAVVSLPKGIL